jgi:hypothetical protein
MKRLAILLLAGVVLAGCGGSSTMSKSDYQAKLQKDGKPVEEALTSLEKSAGSITQLSVFATKVDAAEAAVKSAADDLKSAKPPKDVAADNEALVTGLLAIQAGLEKVKTSAASGGVAGVLAAAAALQASAQYKAAANAISDLEKKGYSVRFVPTGALP